MTIPGRGDLAPPRHEMPIGRVLVTLLVLALLVGGGYAAFLGLSGGSSKPSAAQLPLCPLAPPPPAPSAGLLRLTVMNATEREGLAASARSALRKRGFQVTKIGNTTLVTSGVATVRYSRDRRLVADRVASEIKGSKLVKTPGHGVVELDLGPNYQSLVSVAQAQQAYLRLVPAVAPSPTPSVSCRPRNLVSPGG